MKYLVACQKKNAIFESNKQKLIKALYNFNLSNLINIK